METSMATKELARKFNAIEVFYLGENTMKRQQFQYLLVLDFEATCWAKSDIRRPPEIIEFPVVLYDIEHEEIVEEFQEYVMPVENPKLTDFCTILTGIEQRQVENGIPLPTCLMLFNQWLLKQQLKYNMEFPLLENDTTNKNVCVFATWSDWDLKTCLRNECKRKRITLPSIFTKWIDLREIYKVNYHRPLNGLIGAINDLGLTFEGRQHCGLHDARNTAKLAGKMVADGVLLTLSVKYTTTFPNNA